MTDFIETVRNRLNLPKIEKPELLAPLDLAYIGDNVYELYNRLMALSEGSRQVEKLHRECSERANAKTQAKMVLLLEPLFTEEEAEIYRRGRNAKVYTKAKNASITEYHEATGLEAVVGYLFLREEYERLSGLLLEGFTKLGFVWKKKD